MLYKLVNKEVILVNDGLEWSNSFSNFEDRVVAKDEIDGVVISTVFVGTDMGFNSEHPIVFETMIFGGEYDEYCERYSTWRQAEEGHKRAVEMVLGDKQRTITI